MAEHWVLDYYREIFMGFIKGYDSNIFLFKLNVGLGISCLVVIYYIIIFCWMKGIARVVEDRLDH